MKIQEQEVDVTMSNDLEEGSFYIQATPEAFEALSGGLYKNRILAPIRELSANAYDSHAKKNLTEPGSIDKPFDVHVPNSFDPTFAIRDYGVGLSEEEINTVFRGYFNSTKKNSNDFVGCLGLGSKSPFAYVQSFVVKSFYNGKCFIYNCYKNSKNCPSITKMGEVDTTEPNGLHISFPVASGDFYSFKTEIARAFTFYKVKPNIIGSDVKINQYDYILSNDKFGILKNSSSASLIVMGNIAYPFETKEFYSSSYRFNSEETKLVNWGVHLFVPIGSVSMASSREALTYTPETMSTIKQHLALAVDSLKEEVANKAKSIKTIWEARLYCNSATENVLNRIIVDSNSRGFTMNWGGQQVSDIYKVKSATNPPSSVMSVFLEKAWRRSNKGELILRKNEIESIRASEDLVIIVNDMKLGAYTATHRYLLDKANQRAVLISNDYGKGFLEEFGVPKEQIIFASTLEKAERKPRTIGGVKIARTTLQEYKNGSFENVEVDLNSESGLYFEAKRGEIKIGDGFITSGVVDKVFKYLPILGFSQKIYAVRPCDLDKIKSKSNWKPAEPEIVKFINSLTAIAEESGYAKGYESLHEDVRLKIAKYSRIKRETKFDLCDSFNTLSTALEQYNAVKNVSNNNYFRILVSIFGITFKLKDFSNLLICIKDVETKYPLLKYIGAVEYGMSEEKAKDIGNYIAQINEFSSIKEEAVVDAA